MKWIYIPLSLAITTTSCVSYDLDSMMDKMYNVPETKVSGFDGESHIRMSNMSCQSTLFLELYQDRKKKEAGMVLLSAGTQSITNIGGDNSLQLRVDSEKFSFSPTSSITDHETIYFDHGVTAPRSSKSYLVPETLIKNIAGSKEFFARLHLLNNEYVDGDCGEMKPNSDKGIQKVVEDYNKYSSAITGVREFIPMMDNLNK